jgi:hypothetical protein
MEQSIYILSRDNFNVYAFFAQSAWYECIMVKARLFQLWKYSCDFS